MSAFQDVYGIKMHPDMQRIFRYFTLIFGLNFVPLQWMTEIEIAYIITGVWPYLLCLCVWVLYFLVKRLKKYCKTMNSNTKEESTTIGQIAVVIFYIALPIISKQIFVPKRCKFIPHDEIGDDDYNDQFFSCSSEKLLAFRPSLFAKKFAFLWADFHQNSNIAIYWDIVDSVRKVFLLGFINFIDPRGTSKLLKATIGTAISSLYMLILLYVRPYKRHDDFQLAVLSSYLLTLAFAYSSVLGICEYDGACRIYFGYSLNWKRASIFVIAVMSVMLFVTVAALIFQSQYSPIARLKSTGYPPDLNLHEDCKYHIFMSHKWKGGQDKCHSIARKLQLYMTELRIWLDVDNLSSTENLEQSVKESAVFLLCYSRGYFESKNCRREFFQALHLDKPIIVVYDGSNCELGIMKNECEINCENNDDGLELWSENVWKEKTILWLKSGSFSSESLKLIYLRILKELPYYKEEVGPSACDKGLLMPNDEKILHIKFPLDILVISSNKGSNEIAEEIVIMLDKPVVRIVDMAENGISHDEESLKAPHVVSTIYSHSKSLSDVEPFAIQSLASDKVAEDYVTWFGIVPGCFSLEDMILKESKESITAKNPQQLTDSSEKVEAPTETQFHMNQESGSLLRSQLESKNFKVFLLYLNKDTFAERNIAKLGPILQAVIDEKIPIIVVHEQDHDKGTEPNFDYFLENTPEKFMKVYQDIATPIYTQKEYRQVSLYCIIKKIIEKHDELN
ncbi:hypothetical protein CTEN210_00368 [Chaetoceros tenuissimus]|uniref:TIR domain-containing protein n=1 Tax=Chaetoceros tenuissimus TaxID=426638 RepID=A0AAD3GYR7_9STRA|nr:hypothetical protein CTEN210_00368 [Chaetoceros tenuissimus]